MNAPSPHKAGSAGSRSRDLPSMPVDEDERGLRLEVSGRATAILAELQAEHPDWDTISELALGAHEAVERAL